MLANGSLDGAADSCNDKDGEEEEATGSEEGKGTGVKVWERGIGIMSTETIELGAPNVTEDITNGGHHG